MNAAPAQPVPQRLVGSYGAGAAGPTVVAVAAMHGNEPAGLRAAEQVLATLERRSLPLRGRFLAVVGNVAATAAGTRFVSRDLNRLWFEEELADLRAADPARDDVERAEQRALLALFEELEVEAGGEVVYLDLHSTSAPGPPFHCISDTLHSRAIALASPIPLILGVDEAISGTLLEFMEGRGRPLILVESGQHDDPLSVAFHEAAIWQALVTTGVLDPARLADLAARRRQLVLATATLPSVVEVVHRHAVRPDDGFRMRPGFENFASVRRGDLLAESAAGPVRAAASGFLLMPRYQAQGDDGFFIARRVRPAWLGVSRLFRLARLDRLLPRLPGVRPVPDRPGRFAVDTRVARWFTVRLFHLCGYRRVATRGHRLFFTRRVEG